MATAATGITPGLLPGKENCVSLRPRSSKPRWQKRPLKVIEARQDQGEDEQAQKEQGRAQGDVTRVPVAGWEVTPEVRRGDGLAAIRSLLADALAQVDAEMTTSRAAA